MDSSEIIVLTVGLAAIVFVLWYFFGEKRAFAATAVNSGVQEIRVAVKGGYDPGKIEVKKGIPVRLLFYRDETDSCSEQVIIPAFGIVADLPAYKTTAVEFTPGSAGEYEFTCGMNMLRGKIVVNE